MFSIYCSGLLFGGSIDGGGGGYNAPGGGAFDPFGDIFGGIGDFTGGIGGASASGYNTPQTGYNTPQTGYNTPQTGYGTPQTGYGTPQPQPSYGAPPTSYGGSVPQQTLVTQPLLSGTGGSSYTTFARVDANGNYVLDNVGNYQLTAAPINSPAVTYSTNQLSYQQQPVQQLTNQQLTNQQLQQLQATTFQQRTDTSSGSGSLPSAVTGSGLYTFGQVLPNGQYNSGQQTKSLIGAGASDNSSKDNQYIFYTPNRRR